jgi:hypothetical protein
MSFGLFRAVPNIVLKDDQEVVWSFRTQFLDGGDAARRAALITASLHDAAGPLAPAPRVPPQEPAGTAASGVDEDEPFLVEEPESGPGGGTGGKRGAKGRRKSAASTNPRRNVIEGALAGATTPESVRSLMPGGTFEDGAPRAVTFGTGGAIAVTSAAGAMLSVAMQNPQDAARLDAAGSLVATWKATQDFLAEGVPGRVANGSALMPLDGIALAAPVGGAVVVPTVSGSDAMPGMTWPGGASQAARMEEPFESNLRRPAAGEARQLDGLARDKDPVSGRAADAAQPQAGSQGAAPEHAGPAATPAQAPSPQLATAAPDRPAAGLTASLAGDRVAVGEARDLPRAAQDRPAGAVADPPDLAGAAAVLVDLRPQAERSPLKPALREADLPAPANASDKAEHAGKPKAEPAEVLPVAGIVAGNASEPQAEAPGVAPALADVPDEAKGGPKHAEKQPEPTEALPIMGGVADVPDEAKGGPKHAEKQPEPTEALPIMGGVANVPEEAKGGPKHAEKQPEPAEALPIVADVPEEAKGGPKHAEKQPEPAEALPIVGGVPEEAKGGPKHAEKQPEPAEALPIVADVPEEAKGGPKHAEKQPEPGEALPIVGDVPEEAKGGPKHAEKQPEPAEALPIVANVPEEAKGGPKHAEKQPEPAEALPIVGGVADVPEEVKGRPKHAEKQPELAEPRPVAEVAPIIEAVPIPVEAPVAQPEPAEATPVAQPVVAVPVTVVLQPEKQPEPAIPAPAVEVVVAPELPLQPLPLEATPLVPGIVDQPEKQAEPATPPILVADAIPTPPVLQQPEPLEARPAVGIVGNERPEQPGRQPKDAEAGAKPGAAPDEPKDRPEPPGKQREAVPADPAPGDVAGTVNDRPGRPEDAGKPARDFAGAAPDEDILPILADGDPATPGGFQDLLDLPAQPAEEVPILFEPVLEPEFGVPAYLQGNDWLL